MLIDFARGAVRNLPIAGTAATELHEAQRDEVRALLAAFRNKFIPEMLLDVALIKALIDGPASARASRFSVAGRTPDR